MGIEISFLGRLQLAQLENFSNSLDNLCRSMKGWARCSRFRLPADVMSIVKEIDGVLTAVSEEYPRRACGEKIVVWETMAPSFMGPVAICCNVDWKGAMVLYGTKNYGSAYPLVGDRERLTHDGLDPTIYEGPLWVRVSHTVQGHLDFIKIVDLIKEQFVPNLWVDDDTGYYEKRDIACIERGIKFISSVLGPPEPGKFSAPEQLKELTQEVLLKTGVEKLELGVRYTGCLQRAGIFTIGDLVEKRVSDWKIIRNMTEQGVRFIREAMESLGFFLQE